METRSQAQRDYAELCYRVEVPPHPADTITLALERDRVATVLDGWVSQVDHDYPLRIRTWSVSGSGPGLNCLYSCDGIEEYGAHGEEAWTIFSVPGATPAEARAKAAAAIEAIALDAQDRRKMNAGSWNEGE